MLLEYFLSSGTPELSSDAKAFTSAASVAPNQLTVGDSESFKNALNQSMVGRSKYLNNQLDMKYSESNLLDDVQKWDQLYSGENLEQSNDSEVLKLKTNNLIQSEGNINSSDTVDYKDRFSAGEEVPVDGKPLPENSPLSNQMMVKEEPITAIKQIIVPDEQKKNNLANSSNENKDLKNTKIPFAVTTNVDAKKFIKESTIVADKSAEVSKQPITPQVNDKAVSPFTTTAAANTAANNITTANITAGEVKKSEFFSKELSVAPKETVKVTDSLKQAPELSRISNPKTTIVGNTEVKPPVSDKFISDIKAGITEPNKSLNENLQKTASALLNEEIKKAKTAEIFSVNLKGRNTVTKPIALNGLTTLASQNIPQSQDSTTTIVPESLKLEQPIQLEGQTQQLNIKDINGNPLAEQFIQQVVKHENLSSSLTNTDTASQNSPKTTASTYSGEPITQQIQQQVSSTQTINRHNEVALPVSLPTPQWNKKFAEHVSMLALKGASSAQIKLDPPELGPLAVRIVHTGSETQVQFQVTNPIARELVDSGMNKLREMLEEHGFENVNVDVTEQQNREQHASEDASDLQDIEDKGNVLKPNTSELPEKFKNNALVDLFA